MSDDNKDNPSEADGNDEPGHGSTQSGPKFEKGPDPLAGIKKGAGDIMDSMEGKTVSMKTYVGTIVAVIVLMLLARCGG